MVGIDRAWGDFSTTLLAVDFDQVGIYRSGLGFGSRRCLGLGWAMGFGSVPVRSMTDLELYFPSFRDSRAVVYGREWRVVEHGR